MHPGAAIDMRWIFIRQQEDTHVHWSFSFAAHPLSAVACHRMNVTLPPALMQGAPIRRLAPGGGHHVQFLRDQCPESFPFSSLSRTMSSTRDVWLPNPCSRDRPHAIPGDSDSEGRSR